MLCQQCQQQEANVLITKVVNGQKQELHLCEHCAKKTQQGFSAVFYSGMVPEFLQALIGFSPAEVERSHEETCPHCGIPFSEIRRTGKLGCSYCYEHFEPQMDQLLRRIHGGGQHVGKIPSRKGAALKGKFELKKLKDKLKGLVQSEQFEEAALVRDQIRQLEHEIGGIGDES